MTKLLTWTLHAPSSTTFAQYRDLQAGEPWNSKKWDLIDENGMKSWDYRQRSFIEMIEKFPNRFYAIGLHQFGVNQQGRVYNMGFGTHSFLSYVLNDFKNPSPASAVSKQTAGTSGNLTLKNISSYSQSSERWRLMKTGAVYRLGRYEDRNYVYVGSDERQHLINTGKLIEPINGKFFVDEIEITLPSSAAVGDAWTIDVKEDTQTPRIMKPVEKSLRYLMHTYPQIKWSLQFLCTSNSVGNRVEPVLDNVNGAQDVFIADCHQTMKQYLEAGFTNIKGVEIDFEKTTSRPSDHLKFRDLLVRVKNEVCLPLGLELRVNMFAMTGDFNPSYYGWHDYATLAGGKDKNGKQAIDEFQLMAYDFSWGGSAPGPSTPIWWLENILKHIKDLENRGVWKANKVFVGNAGYGRRWPLGENRYGVTLDYKQLMLAQNGAYIHNSGADDPDGNFYFNDQDFIPVSGFNDDDSDYQRTFLGVYDRFDLTDNGGSVVPAGKGNYINQPEGAAYVTNYSRKQFPVFSGVSSIAFAPSTVKGRTTRTKEQWNAVRATGLSTTSAYGYVGKGQFNPEDWNLGDPVQEENKGAEIVYTFDYTGSKRLIAAVFWPFFEKASIWIDLNGKRIHLDGNSVDWNPFMQAQEPHFIDLGVQSFSGTNTIKIIGYDNFDSSDPIESQNIGSTNDASIYGFVVCSEFDYNMRGGEIKFPTSCYPMKRRGSVDSNGKVKLIDAKYPDFMRIVGEVLTRTPRPAIIWEDIFSSYVDEEKPSYNILAENYYQGPYTEGTWNAKYGGEADYNHAFTDSRNGLSQIVLNKRFSVNMAIDIEVRADRNDGQAIYGIRALANSGVRSGYACYLDFNRKQVRIDHEKMVNGSLQVTNIGSEPMTNTLLAMNGQRIRLRVYVLGNKLSFWVEKNPYFNRIDIPELPSSGAYGIMANKCRLKAYKYNVSTLDRFERMERLEITTGGKTYYFDEVDRKSGTEYDEYGYIKFTGYPAEISDHVADLKDPDAVDGETNLATNTIIDTQVNPDFGWSNDYKNKALAVVPAWGEYDSNGKWTGAKQDVTIKFKDAGIWFKNFYVGDDEGMSIAYNSDRIGFIRTANLVNEYNCKGIGLWTLGQEDPTIYSYIPNN